MSITVKLIVCYLFYTVATPWNSGTLSFLEVIHVDEVLLFFIVILTVSNAAGKKLDSLSWCYVFLFFTMLLSMFLSPYFNFPKSYVWRSEYWRMVVLFFAVMFGVKNTRDFNMLITGVLVVSLLYQLYSWVDFLLGGSYVGQQGIKRMIGTWSGGGYGAANGWGVLGGFYSLFCLFLLELVEKKKHKLLLYFCMIVCVGSCLASGTRAAVVSLIIVLFIKYRKKLFSISGCVVLAIIICGIYLSLSEDLKNRYTSQMMIFSSSNEELTKTEKVAKLSAESRVDGLVDGWKLLLKRPLLGYGPGTSSMARTEVRDMTITSGNMKGELFILQLHNLYGQIMAEIGILGSVLFVFLVWQYFGHLKWKGVDERSAKIHYVWNEQRGFLTTAMIFILVYGNFGHNLYTYYFPFLLGLNSAFCKFSRESDN